jgi:hypothetical protein
VVGVCESMHTLTRHTSLHTYIHTYIHTHTHTYIHTYIHINDANVRFRAVFWRSFEAQTLIELDAVRSLPCRDQGPSRTDQLDVIRAEAADELRLPLDIEVIMRQTQSASDEPVRWSTYRPMFLCMRSHFGLVAIRCPETMVIQVG